MIHIYGWFLTSLNEQKACVNIFRRFLFSFELEQSEVEYLGFQSTRKTFRSI
jgi:hypothetical protein